VKPEILETTVPAASACGMRTFQVRWEGLSGEPETAVDVSVCGLESRALTGEKIELLEIEDRVPTNKEVAHALIHLAAALLDTAGAQLSNPND
jgi:hypothetical protein